MKNFLSILIFILISINVFSQDVKFREEILDDPQKFSDTLDKYFNINEIKVFDTSFVENQVILKNGYVKSKIINKDDWSPTKNNKIVTQIDIVFTKYPREKDQWRTNYYQLLSSRLKELFIIDAKLNSNLFEWNLVLQTDCRTEEETKNFFHGIVIKYLEVDKIKPGEEVDETPIQNPEYFHKNILKVNNFIKSQGGYKDSVILKIFDRNRNWENALIVMDWTGSMYPYAAQAVLWHALNFNKSGIKYFTFFNDGDNTKNSKKVIGKTGGIYFSKAQNLENLINTFYLVSKNGNGGDAPENDIEALLKAVDHYPEFDEIILIADNNSCIRDYSLLKQLDASVKIILCGTYYGINPQYINLAYQTGGSIHTLKSDIRNLSTKLKNDTIKIGGLKYRLNESDVFENITKLSYAEYNDCGKYSMYNKTTATDILNFIVKEGGIKDSSVFKVLDRHPLWQNSLVVLNWTSEMYTNSAQAVLWQKLNMKKSGINYYAFFNDGDKRKKREKKIGKTFGVYATKANNIRRVTKRFNYVKKRGKGGDDGAENDVEAVIRASMKYKDFENLILITNNNSCVRDIKLLEYANKPIKIILSNTSEGINPQYLTIAYKTGGSIHTIDHDIYNYVIKSTVNENKPLLINGIEYVLDSKGMFQYNDKELSKSQHNCGKYEKGPALKDIFIRN